MDLTTATPAEIDTRLADLYGQRHDAAVKVFRAMESIHYAADDKRVYYSDRNWAMTDAEAIAAVEAKTDDERSWISREATEALARLDAAKAEVARLDAESAPLNAEYRRRGGWTRAFLAKSANGHVHNGMDCSTCNKMGKVTDFEWFPEYSGKPEAEIVADAGERACTTCYPTAPVEVLSRPTKFFSQDEKDAAKAREERAAAKAQRDAKKIANGLTVDGSEFVVTYTESNAGQYRRNEQGQTVHFYGPKQRTERFKTERAAVQWVVQYVAWGHTGEDDDMFPGFQQVVEAVAAKHGKPVGHVWAEIDAKVAAKKKRDAR